MNERFTNLPDRLRKGAECIGEGNAIELGDAICITSMMRDAALKIEALERDAKRKPNKP